MAQAVDEQADLLVPVRGGLDPRLCEPTGAPLPRYRYRSSHYTGWYALLALSVYSLRSMASSAPAALAAGAA